MEHDVILGLEIAAQILEMRLGAIKAAPPVNWSWAAKMCKSRAINEMEASIAHVRNFINSQALIDDALIKVEAGINKEMMNQF